MKSIKFTALLPILAISISLISCEAEEIAPTDAEMTHEAVHDISSGTFRLTEEYKIDYSEEESYFFPGCNQEPLRITEGILQVRYTIQYNNNKGVIRLHSNTSNFRVVGENTGTNYVGHSVSNWIQHFDVPTFYPYRFRQTLNFVLAAPGRDNNILITAVMHYEAHADGSVKIYVDKYRVDCQK